MANTNCLKSITEQWIPSHDCDLWLSCVWFALQSGPVVVRPSEWLYWIATQSGTVYLAAHLSRSHCIAGTVVINCIARTRRVSVYFTVQRYLERALLRSKWICCTEFHYNMHWIPLQHTTVDVLYRTALQQSGSDRFPLLQSGFVCPKIQPYDIKLHYCQINLSHWIPLYYSVQPW